MIKRIFDIFFSFSGLIILSPLFIILAIIIISESRGGVFFRQKRVGENSKIFRIFKFRSMYSGSDKKHRLTVGSGDSRITKSGKFIRKYKLDEIPQLINVLLGDMSLVGPRPEVPEYVKLYNDEQKQVLKVKPGITDYASIEYSDENELLAKADDVERMYVEEIMPAKLKLNLKYIDEMSLKTDLRIIFSTIRKVF